MSTLEQNIARLDGYLAQFKKSGILNRIAGKDVPGSGGVFESVSPVDKSVICKVAQGSAKDIDTAAIAAAENFPIWRDMPATERRKILINVAQGIEAMARVVEGTTRQGADRMTKVARAGVAPAVHLLMKTMVTSILMTFQ